MELSELLSALHAEMEAAGHSRKGASASLAFVARKDREGMVEIDFVDSGALSKPRAEELHHLEIPLGNRVQPKVADRPAFAQGEDETKSPFQVVAEPASRAGKPPALPPKRT